MSLPILKTSDRVLLSIETQWSSILNPVIANPIVQGVQISNIAIKTGTNVINHLLDRNQQGWFVTDATAAITLYRSKPLNDKTLTLVASAPATISLWVY